MLSDSKYKYFYRNNFEYTGKLIKWQNVTWLQPQAFFYNIVTERDALVTFYVTVIAFDVTAISNTLQSLSVIETWMKECVQIND